MMKDMVQVRRGKGQSYKGPDVKIGRSQFNRSHHLKTAFDSGYITPIFVDEVLPGDTFTCRLNGFVRIFSPLDAPILDNIELETLFFFVPNRLLWDNWEFFQGAHDGSGAQDTDYTIPILATGLTVDHDGGTGTPDLAAFFGLPDGLTTAAVEVNALPFRAYNLIYNEWFRDQNLKAIAGGGYTDNGPDPHAAYILRKSAKKHDYFTSALPYLQKGSAQTVALAGSPLVEFDGVTGAKLEVWATTYSGEQQIDTDGAQADLSTSGGTAANVLRVDLSTLGTVDINALRLGIAIQRLLETDARGGTRYTEMLKSHFGVISPDFRLQRPEYLGGGKSMINVSPVANTSDTATYEQGELAGVGTGVINGHSWAKSFVEHGYILGFVRARGDVTYFQGLDRLWSRTTRYDFYMPALANLGEQSILNKELFISNLLATDDAVFGYQARWEEYRMKKSMITGVLNPDAASNLSYWHLAEDFASLPVLNSTFIEDQTPMDRVTTLDTGQQFLLDLFFELKCARPIPIFSVPSLTAQRF